MFMDIAPGVSVHDLTFFTPPRKMGLVQRLLESLDSSLLVQVGAPGGVGGWGRRRGWVGGVVAVRGGGVQGVQHCLLQEGVLSGLLAQARVGSGWVWGARGREVAQQPPPSVGAEVPPPGASHVNTHTHTTTPRRPPCLTC